MNQNSHMILSLLGYLIYRWTEVCCKFQAHIHLARQHTHSNIQSMSLHVFTMTLRTVDSYRASLHHTDLFWRLTRLMYYCLLFGISVWVYVLNTSYMTHCCLFLGCYILEWRAVTVIHSSVDSLGTIQVFQRPQMFACPRRSSQRGSEGRRH